MACSGKQTLVGRRERTSLKAPAGEASEHFVYERSYLVTILAKVRPRVS